MAGDSSTALDQLQQFLQDGAAREFDWLSCNCGFWVCEWVKLRSGIDPAADFRRFKTAEGFLRAVARSGGNEAFSRKIAAGAALKETIEPKRGDVGLIATAAGPTMAIHVGDDRWAAKSPRGVVIAPFAHIVAWSI